MSTKYIVTSIWIESITSPHLKILRMSGVVSESTGKFHIYQINYDVINKASLP
ncbi:MAG: hypothetical protein IPN46_01280 [Saprospiraceae bacterium]|nr:hypothetical protein [Saprospiraceae bacterium]